MLAPLLLPEGKGKKVTETEHYGKSTTIYVGNEKNNYKLVKWLQHHSTSLKIVNHYVCAKEVEDKLGLSLLLQ